MSIYVLSLKDLDASMVEVAGGKGANLGALTAIEGIRVPDGFCILAQAWKQTVRSSPTINRLLERLSLVKVGDRDDIQALSQEIRATIQGLAIPKHMVAEMTRHFTRIGEQHAYAVRSSATAEDLPTASFAGQQQSYLNVIGKEAILKHISKCWASLFTERAISYRIQKGIDHREVDMSVIVQKMVFPEAAGVLFTADPVSGHRKVSSIDASFGLGDALVLGLVDLDTYHVKLDRSDKVANKRAGEVIEKKIAIKKRATVALKEGGTRLQEVPPEQQNRQVLTDEQILQLARIGRNIEQHFGCPQDIEWCLVEDTFYIVQSRPITTLFPVPKAHDGENRVYVSVGHQQMMTDPIKPLGLSFYLLTTSAPMRHAGGRLFVDVTPMLAAPASRDAVINALGQSDPLIKDALLTVVSRENFIKPISDAPSNKRPPNSHAHAASKDGPPLQQDGDPAIVDELIRRSQASMAALQQHIQAKTGPDLFDFLLQDIEKLKVLLFHPQSMGVIMAAMDASAWLNEHMEAWLGEKSVADTLSQSAPNNVTSEMGLALLDVADVIRPYPEVVDYLRSVSEQFGEKMDKDTFLDELVKCHGGREARDALELFLSQYGMRCVGEIDITRTRWSEKPTILVPVLLSHIDHFGPEAARRKFERGRQAALQKERALLDRLRSLPDGNEKAQQTKAKIDLLRNWIGYREFPKYSMVQRYFIYKQALLQEADRLVKASVIHEKEDIYYLTFDELRKVVRTQDLDDRIISQRKADYRLYEGLTPPRVMTSDGEVIAGQYRRDNLPAHALIGLPVSSGVVEGRARVILNMEDADLIDGDILVTTFTDPSWTPWFVSIKGLVTEVGGLMTHGAVVAREYGLPAVVGVEQATTRIKDGQYIRVHGTEGYVEIL